MSADNILGIYKVNSRKYIARNCFSECEEDCSECDCHVVFTAKSMTEAVKKAEAEMQSQDMIYEYGYTFKNI